MKSTIFHNEHFNIIISKLDIIDDKCKENLKTHSHYHHITKLLLKKKQKSYQNHTLPHSFIRTSIIMSHMYKTKTLRANKSLLLQIYLHKVNLSTYIPQSSLCLTHTHDTNHLYQPNTMPLVYEKNLWKQQMSSKSKSLDWLLLEVKGWFLQDILEGGITKITTK